MAAPVSNFIVSNFTTVFNTDNANFRATRFARRSTSNNRRGSANNIMRRISSVNSMNSTLSLGSIASSPMDLDAVSGESRQKLIIALLTKIIISYQAVHQNTNIYFVIDDSENMDAATLAFLTSVNLPKLFIVFATSKQPPSSVLQIQVPPLSPSAVLSILKGALNAPEEISVEESLAKAFIEASNGCGAYARTLAEYLKRNRLLLGRKVVKANSEIRLNERGQTKLSSLPEAITSHLQSLLDSTTPESGLLIKAASILPVDFSQATLTSLYSKLQNSPPPSHSALELLQSGLLRETMGHDAEADSVQLSFSNMQVRAQVYGSLTSTQRTSLHNNYLNILEKEHGECV